jgi:hypothetical protein
MVVLAGREKAGKTWAALLASSSELVADTYYVGIGEDDPDEYALIPGAKFKIVLHDGSYDGILQAVRQVAALPPVDGKPNLLIIDSMTKLWELVVDNSQAVANQRAKGKKTAGGEFAISPDLWNVAAAKWKAVVDAVRELKGPSVLTARLDEVMVMENGQPTKDKTWKVQAHKSLVFDAGVLVEMHRRGHALITGTRSVRMALDKPVEAPDFTIKELWDRLGITAKTEMGERTHQGTVTDDVSPEAVLARWTAKAKAKTSQAGFEQVYGDALKAEVDTEVLDAIKLIAAAWQAHQAPPLDGAGAGKAAPRAWVTEAQKMTHAEDVEALRKEAEALGANQRILKQLADIGAVLPVKPVAAPSGEWAAVSEDTEPKADTPAVLEPVLDGGDPQ